VAERTLLALEVLADAPGGLGVTELGRRLGVDKSTAHRLLATLQARGFVRLIPSSRRYTLGLRLISLGTAAAQGVDLTEIARPHLETLRDQTGETASLAVLSEGEVLFLSRLTGSGVLTVNHGVGTRLPAHCSALGKVLLAALAGSAEVERIIATRGLARYTPRTITEPDELMRHLHLVRRRGWALDDEEYAIGLRCLAAPVYDATGALVAATGIAGPTTRITLEQIDRMAALVCRTGREISAALGYRWGAGDGAGASATREPGYGTFLADVPPVSPQRGAQRRSGDSGAASYSGTAWGGGAPTAE
jgi:DNA-binding IclR family transcriptional regulator